MHNSIETVQDSKRFEESDAELALRHGMGTHPARAPTNASFGPHAQLNNGLLRSVETNAKSKETGAFKGGMGRVSEHTYEEYGSATKLPNLTNSITHSQEGGRGIRKGEPQVEKKKGRTYHELDSDEEERFLNYAPEHPELLDWDSLKLEENFAVKIFKNSHYLGQLDPAMKRCGKGVISYGSGRVYEGGWEDDVRHGRGFERFASGNTFLGEYNMGRVDGQGKYAWATGEFFDGLWEEGLKAGYGHWQGANGDTFIGEWKDNQPNGFGKHIWANGDSYEGEWKMCVRHGQGADLFACGDNYVGEYARGKAEGYGQYRWKNGNVYAGQFLNGIKSGQGHWRREDGSDTCNQYQGAYEDDKKHGFGQFTWETGSTYKGQYTGDKKAGYGEMQWADGNTYKGYWDEGIQNGIGLMTFADGTQRAGFFVNNVYSAPLNSVDEI